MARGHEKTDSNYLVLYDFTHDTVVADLVAS
jgi:hypothetical protein